MSELVTCGRLRVRTRRAIASAPLDLFDGDEQVGSITMAGRAEQRELLEAVEAQTGGGRGPVESDRGAGLLGGLRRAWSRRSRSAQTVRDRHDRVVLHVVRSGGTVWVTDESLRLLGSVTQPERDRRAFLTADGSLLGIGVLTDRHRWAKLSVQKVPVWAVSAADGSDAGVMGPPQSERTRAAEYLIERRAPPPLGGLLLGFAAFEARAAYKQAFRETTVA